MVVVIRLGGSSLHRGPTPPGARETRFRTWSELWGHRFAASLRRLSSGGAAPLTTPAPPVLYPLSHVRVLNHAGAQAVLADDLRSLGAPSTGASGTH